MEAISFAIGYNGTYIYGAPKLFARDNLPKKLEAEWNNVATIICTAFGPQENSWVIGYLDTNSNFRITWGDGLPQALVSWIYDSEKNCYKRDRQLKIALGPGDSFFAWDSKSIRWSNIPAKFEKDIQEEWLSPTGWLHGPPRIVALGGNGIYLALSQYGSVLNSWIPDGLFNKVAKWCEEDAFSWRNIKHFVLSPVDNSSYIVIKDNLNYDYNLPNDYSTPAFFAVVDSLADEATQKARFLQRENARVENKRKIEEDERKRREKEHQEFEDRQRQAKADEERAAKAQQEADAEQAAKTREEALKAELSRAYSTWKLECNTRLSSQSLLTVFPSVPRKVCFCIDATCSSHKNVEGSLMVCRHDMGRLLRASGMYSQSWLRKESLVWHPDRFRQKCDPDYQVALCKKATEMFAIFGALIDEERNRHTTI